MSIVLVDTNIAIKLIKQREPLLAHRVVDAIRSGTVLALSAISMHELEFGIARNANPATARMRNDQFMQLVSHVLDFDPGDAVVAAEIRHGLASRGQGIGMFDVLIAAQAVRRNIPVITNNMREFERVAGLRCIDWTKA